MNPEIHEGMEVRAADGERLGVVVRRTEEGFAIERGLFFPRTYLARYGDVAQVSDGEVVLARGKEELARGEVPERREVPQAARAVAPGPTGAIREEIHVPLVEEEPVIQTVPRESGRVRIQKRVVTEMRTFTVPVRREEIQIEHLPADGDGAARAEAAEGGAFEERTFVIPLYEEEVRIEKQAVVYEEVRVTKAVRRETEQARVEVRREVAKVDDQGAVEALEPVAEPQHH